MNIVRLLLFPETVSNVNANQQIKQSQFDLCIGLFDESMQLASEQVCGWLPMIYNKIM